MLFVYNHDNAYDKNFASLLASIDLSDVTIPKGSRLFVLGPEDIYWLNNVSYEVRQMRGDSEIPSKELCYFYHPQLARRKNVQVREAKAATLEMLMGPWITLRYKNKTGKDGVVLFYRGKGSKPDEFLQIIDHLMPKAKLEAEPIPLYCATDNEMYSSLMSAPQHFNQNGLLDMGRQRGILY